MAGWNGRLLSFWEGNFSGAMLNFGGVLEFCSDVSESRCHQNSKDTRLDDWKSEYRRACCLLG